MAADPMQEPMLSPEEPVEPVAEGYGPPAPEEPPEPITAEALEGDVDEGHENDDIAEEVEQAIFAGCTQAKAFAEGKPEQINPDSYKTIMAGIQAGCLALAAIRPPTPALDPNAVMQDQTKAAGAVLQDQQAEEQVKAQLTLGKQREGRPSGPAKPVSKR